MLTFLSRTFLIFLAYSIAGHLMEVIFCSTLAKKYVKRGFFIGPYSPIYGFGAYLILIFMTPFKGYPLFVFLGSMVICGAFEYFSSYLLEKCFHLKWWDYSKKRWNINGRVCLQNLFAFALFGVLTIYYFHPFLLYVTSLIPQYWLNISGWLLFFFFVLDFVISAYNYLNKTKSVRDLLSEVASTLLDPEEISRKLKGIEAQLKKPATLPNELKTKLLEQKKLTIAPPWGIIIVNLYHCFWVFVYGSVLGYFIEMIYAYAKSGVVESRQGLVFGPFSQVYGAGAVVICIILAKTKKQYDFGIFIFSALLGGIFEAGFSYVQQSLLGVISWQYQPADLALFGGRTSIKYMFFWGILGYLYIKFIDPFLERWTPPFTNKIWRRVTLVFIVFLFFDIGVSGVAVLRWQQRIEGVAKPSAIGTLVDEYFPNERMNIIYPNMQRAKKEE